MIQIEWIAILQTIGSFKKLQAFYDVLPKATFIECFPKQEQISMLLFQGNFKTFKIKNQTCMKNKNNTVNKEIVTKTFKPFIILFPRENMPFLDYHNSFVLVG